MQTHTALPAWPTSHGSRTLTTIAKVPAGPSSSKGRLSETIEKGKSMENKQESLACGIALKQSMASKGFKALTNKQAQEGGHGGHVRPPGLQLVRHGATRALFQPLLTKPVCCANTAAPG
jgi:hypothetical protein